MKKKLLNIFLILVLLGTAFITVNTSVNVRAMSEADNVVGTADVPSENHASTFIAGHSAKDGSSYKASNNNYNDGVVSYYFVTGDVAYSTKNGQVETVVYDGISFNAQVIYSARKNYTKAVNGIDVLNASPIPLMKDNSTYFYDDGNFIDEDFDYNYNLSGNNKSILGIHLDGSGESQTKFYKLPYPTNYPTTPSFAGYKARILFNHPNTYVANVVFDGSDIDMAPLGNSSIPKNRGEFFWFLSTNTENFVAKNIVLQNIGGDNVTDGSVFFGTARKNVALNLYTPVTGQRNLENLTIRNCKTKAGYGVVSFNQTANNYFKNLNVENANNTGTGIAHNNTAYPIKVEASSATNLPSAQYSSQKNIVFDGELKFPNIENLSNSLYIQDYRYKNILVPSTLTFALCKTNGNGTNTTPAIRLYNRKINTIPNHMLYEVGAEYWVVEAANSAVPIDTQLMNIRTLITNQNLNTGVPKPHIKLIAKDDATIGGFTIPDFTTAYNNGGIYTTNIVALAQTETPATTIYPATAHASNQKAREYVAFLPSTASDSITLPTANANKVLLFNIDFKTRAKYTIENAIGGKVGNFTKESSGKNLFLKYLVNVTFLGIKDNEIISTQEINQNGYAITPMNEFVSKVGYTFNGWTTNANRMPPYVQKTDIDTSQIGTDTVYYASYTAKTDTQYQIEHYLEQSDGTYKREETENKTGTTGTLATATTKTYTGYAFDPTVTNTKQTGTIVNDGTLVLKLYYKVKKSNIIPVTQKQTPYVDSETDISKLPDTGRKSNMLEGMNIILGICGIVAYMKKKRVL